MNILARNFIKLLSAGTFNVEDTVEPMSEYKWKRLLSAAETYKVQDFIGNGITTICKSGVTIIPTRIQEAAQNLTVAKEYGKKQDYTKLDTITVSGKAKPFANFYLNRKYNKIVFNEIHSIDTSIDSIVFINKLIENINKLLNSGLDFRSLSDLGFYLRLNGDKIDFVKTDGWIKALKIQGIANLIGNCLVQLFNFDNDELPFITETDDKYLHTISREIDNMITNPTRHIEINDNSPQKGINPIKKPNSHPIKYKSYCPLETSSRFMANIIKSLSNIDE